MDHACRRGGGAREGRCTAEKKEKKKRMPSYLVMRSCLRTSSLTHLFDRGWGMRVGKTKQLKMQ